MHSEVPFYEMLLTDESGITVAYYNSLKEIPFLENNSYVAAHQHDFFEIMLIRHGSCQYIYSDHTIPLIPGDLLFSPPGDTHSYRFHEAVCFNTCQFTVEAARKLNITNMLQEIQQVAFKERHLKYLNSFEQSEKHIGMQYPHGEDTQFNRETADWSKEENRSFEVPRQEIMHLTQDAQRFFEDTLDELLKEQNRRLPEYVRLKEAILTCLIIQMVRIKKNTFNILKDIPDTQSQMIFGAIDKIGANLEETFDYKEYAKQNNLSASHFRKLFKDITGLPPNEYVSRLRILRALELLENTRIPVSQVAEAVGIRDQNYFSRLFRKTIGCSPSSYRYS